MAKFKDNGDGKWLVGGEEPRAFCLYNWIDNEGRDNIQWEVEELRVKAEQGKHGDTIFEMRLDGAQWVSRPNQVYCG